MEIPDLVRQAAGGEEIQASVNLGDEDAVCLTPTRTLLYRAEGLLSDEKLEEFPHDVDRVSVEQGRRKTKFVLEYVGENRTFSVPNGRTERVLKLLMEGILTEDDVVGVDESIGAVFLFSELALIVTEGRVVRHIGSAVWSPDYEEYPYSALTGLSFDQGNVATEVVLEVGGRPHRIKTPTDRAPQVQQAIEAAVFDFYGVGSLGELNATIAEDEPDGDDGETEASVSSDIEIGDGIDPLVSQDDGGADQEAGRGGESARVDAATDSGQADSGGTAVETPTEGAHSDGGDHPTSADLEDVNEQLMELTTAVQRQNDLLTQQHETIKQLIDELRR